MHVTELPLPVDHEKTNHEHPSQVKIQVVKAQQFHPQYSSIDVKSGYQPNGYATDCHASISELGRSLARRLVSAENDKSLLGNAPTNVESPSTSKTFRPPCITPLKRKIGRRIKSADYIHLHETEREDWEREISYSPEAPDVTYDWPRMSPAIPAADGSIRSPHVAELSQEQIQYNYREFEEKAKRKAAEKAYFTFTTPGSDGSVSPMNEVDEDLERAFLEQSGDEAYLFEDEDLDEDIQDDEEEEDED